MKWKFKGKGYKLNLYDIQYATLKRVGPHCAKVSKVVGDCFDLPGDSWLIILLALVDDEEHHQKKSDDDIEHQVPPPTHSILI